MGQNRYPVRGKEQRSYLSTTPTATPHNLTLDQMQAEVIAFGTYSGAWVAQFPIYPKDAGMQFVINNASGQACTIKGYTADGGTTPTTGIALTADRKMIVAWTGSDFIQVTADKT